MGIIKGIIKAVHVSNISPASPDSFSGIFAKNIVLIGTRIHALFVPNNRRAMREDN